MHLQASLFSLAVCRQIARSGVRIVPEHVAIRSARAKEGPIDVTLIYHIGKIAARSAERPFAPKVNLALFFPRWSLVSQDYAFLKKLRKLEASHAPKTIMKHANRSSARFVSL